MAIARHWLIALIIIGTLAGGLLVDTLFAGTDPATRANKLFFIGLHKSFGLTLIAPTLVRIVWRLAGPPPPFPAYLTRTEMVLASAAQLLFYGLMPAMPLSGWAMGSTGKRQFALQWLGLFAVAQLPRPKSLGAVFGDAHEWLGYLMIATPERSELSEI